MKTYSMLLLCFLTLAAYGQHTWITFTSEDGLINNWVRTMVEDDDGAMWFGTDAGVSRYEDGIWSEYNAQNSPLGNSIVYRAFRSKNGDLCFATYGEGVFVYADEQWLSYNCDNSGLSFDTVVVIAQEREGAMWFGTLGGGACRLQEGVWTSYHSRNSALKADSVFSILQDREGTLWFGTGTAGIFTLDQNQWNQFHPENSDLLSYEVRDILQASDGALWFAIWRSDRSAAFLYRGGVNRYQDGQWQAFTPDNSGLKDEEIFRIYEDNEGALWFGSDNNGAFRYKEGAWQIYNTTNSGIAGYFVSSILQDDQMSYFSLLFGFGSGSNCRTQNRENMDYDPKRDEPSLFG